MIDCILCWNLADTYQYQLQALWQKAWATGQGVMQNLRFRERGPFKTWRPETMAEAIMAVLREGLSLSQVSVPPSPHRPHTVPTPPPPLPYAAGAALCPRHRCPMPPVLPYAAAAGAALCPRRRCPMPPLRRDEQTVGVDFCCRGDVIDRHNHKSQSSS